jgi:shikimate kinase
MSPRVILVGLPGTGKSTSGRRLAKVMCVDFADSDELVEAAEGRDVRAIFAESGEGEFRAAEHRAISSCLAGGFDGVLALGGGALTHEPTRTAIAGSGVVVAVERQPLYDSVATLEVDTAARTPGQVAAHIAARLHAMGVLS